MHACQWLAGLTYGIACSPVFKEASAEENGGAVGRCVQKRRITSQRTKYSVFKLQHLPDYCRLLLLLWLTGVTYAAHETSVADIIVDSTLQCFKIIWSFALRLAIAITCTFLCLEFTYTTVVGQGHGFALKKIGENILNEFLQKLLTQLVTGHRVIDYGRVGSGLGSKLYTRCGWKTYPDENCNFSQTA